MSCWSMRAVFAQSKHDLFITCVLFSQQDIRNSQACQTTTWASQGVSVSIHNLNVSRVFFAIMDVSYHSFLLSMICVDSSDDHWDFLLISCSSCHVHISSQQPFFLIHHHDEPLWVENFGHILGPSGIFWPFWYFRVFDVHRNMMDALLRFFQLVKVYAGVELKYSFAVARVEILVFGLAMF